MSAFNFSSQLRSCLSTDMERSLYEFLQGVLILIISANFFRDFLVKYIGNLLACSFETYFAAFWGIHALI